MSLLKKGAVNQISRRNFVRFMLAGGAATMLDCSVQRQPGRLVSNVEPPEELIPGKSLYFASTCRECPAGCGLHVCTRDGRVVKLEGNPHHPVNRGALCARGQASLQGLYDPDRVTQPLQRSESGAFQPVSWETALTTAAEALSAVASRGEAERLVLLSGGLGPTLSGLASEWLAALGSGRLLQYEALGYEFLKSANRLTFGVEEIPLFALDKARFVLSLGCDFLETWLSPVEFSHAFSKLRTYFRGQMGRLAQVESRLSLTGANADDWIRIRPGTEKELVFALLNIIVTEKLAAANGVDVSEIAEAVADYDVDRVSRISDIPSDVIYALARTFAREKPSLALFGGAACTSATATATQVGVNLLNYLIGNIGETVVFGADLYPVGLNRYQEIAGLADDMAAGKVEALIICQTNPAFTLPPKSGFQEALEKVPLVVALSSALDETAAQADLVLPIQTPLEAWDDYSCRQSIRGLLQPAVEALPGSRHPGDILLELGRRALTGSNRFAEPESYYELLKEQWRQLQRQERPDLDFDSFWKSAVMGGGVWKESVVETPTLRPDWKGIDLKVDLPWEGEDGTGPALVTYPSILHFDGRSAGRPWLQELPQPLTDVVWDSYVEIHPETAEDLGLKDGDVARIRSPHGEILLPVFVHPWLHPEAVAVPFGQGRTHGGRYARARGANPALLLGRVTDAESGGFCWLSVRVQVAKTDIRHHLVSTRGELSEGGREIAQTISLSELARAPMTHETGTGTHHPVANLYPEHAHPKHSWGMVIDLNACIGCRACEVACYAENNIPMVGKQAVALGREMSWLRIESYTEREELPRFTFLPVLCQHCHHAPCESVCPVFATYHNPEGLNAQIYNRCVGTRYCSNNCPYNARRFNFFEPHFDSPLDRQLNPHVTVRGNGIMEKCTFCYQRIVEAKNRAADEGRNLQEGDVVPACSQTCPTRAITFGDLNDPESSVFLQSRDSRAYQLLEHLNTRPAITYLKKITRRSGTA